LFLFNFINCFADLGFKGTFRIAFLIAIANKANNFKGLAKFNKLAKINLAIL